MEYLFRCGKMVHLPSLYRDHSTLETKGVCIATESNTLVDLKLLSAYASTPPQHKNTKSRRPAFKGKLDFNSAFVWKVDADVAKSMSPKVFACIRLAAPLQPMFDILIDQKIVGDDSSLLPLHCRTYVECKWSNTSDQEDDDLAVWIKDRVLPFMGTA